MAQTTHRDTVMRVLESAVANLQKHVEEINDLNVFPIPDGDTGSNMTATLNSAWNNISDDSITDVEIFADFSKGALLGARGNSGVILSQIIKGMSEGVKEIGSFTFNKEALKIIFKSACEYAYNSVSNPVEGTILSVVKAVTVEMENSEETNSLEDALTNVVKIAQKATDYTPEQLPILKESGVVDSGAFGLVKFIEGAIMGTQGKTVKIGTIGGTPAKKTALSKADPINNIGYCTEFVLTLKDTESFKKDAFKEKLLKLGDSLVYIVEDDIVKVHIHSKTPGKVFTLAQKFGEFSTIKSDNMAMQAEGEGHDVNGDSFIVTKKSSNPNKELGIIAVSNGVGLANEMQKLGATEIISGGQSMNPSVKEFMDIINAMPYKKIVLLPNNYNIILTVETVQKNVSDKEIFIVPTKTLQQGIVALKNINPLMFDFENYIDNTKEAVALIEEGQITIAVRDTNMNGIQVKEGEFISVSGKKIISSSSDLQLIFETLTNYIVESSDDIGLITIFYNEKVSPDDQIKIKKFMAEKYSDIELEITYGGQEVYHIIMFGEE